MSKEVLAANTSLPPIIWRLGFAGLLPFVGLSFLLTKASWFGAGLQSASFLGFYAPYVFIAYSAVILSFLSGTLWSRWELVDDEGTAKIILIFSNIIALSAWLSLLLIYIAPVMTIFAVTLLLVGFVSVLWVERFSKPTRVDYLKMRVYLTLGVAGTHILVIALMLVDL